ncbi:MAG: hypothetical protein NC824_05905 [Candidatus Omnitrophica bacterium]|nr:hypothetical protein [Candidatus Omnitrophota bacterium]
MVEEINEYRLKGVREWGMKCNISADICFTTQDLPGVYKIKIEKAMDGRIYPKVKSLENVN